MECNGFNSDNYRYFYLDRSKDWSGFTNHTYGKLLGNDIIKISREDLKIRLFNSNYWDRIIQNIYEHYIVEYPINEPFDLYKYISMQNPITFKWDGILNFCYDEGEYAIINEWLGKKMSSNKPLVSMFPGESVCEKNQKILDMICEEEKIRVKSIEDKIENQLPCEIEPQVFKFKKDTIFKLPYQKGETWILTDSSIFLALFNQDFIRLLSNSTEILGLEKERIFLEEYQDNIPNMTRRYYRVKENIVIDSVYQIMGDCSLESFDVGFESMVVRMNGVIVETCKLNSDNTVRCFFVDYSDSFKDRIAEKEILKIAYRLPQVDAKKLEDENINIIKEKQQFEEAVEYIRKNKKRYEKYCQRNDNPTPESFMNNEKEQLVKRLINTFNNRIDVIE